jgi:hypothetical protein
VLAAIQAALLFLAQTLTRHAVTDSAGVSKTEVGGAGLTFLVLALTAVAQLLVAAMIAIVVQRGVLGQPITVGDAWAVVRPRSWRVLGGSILAGLAMFGGLILLIIPGVYLWAALSFTTVVIVIENSGAAAALGRSRRLVQGAWWRTFGILLLVYLISGIVSTIIRVPFNIGAIGTAIGGGQPSLGDAALQDLGGLLAAVFTVPFTAAAIALLYIDRRMRSEGLDLALQQAAAQG